MKKNLKFLAVLAVVLVLGSSIGSAWAYFTTYTSARGGYVMKLGDETEIGEKFSEWTKHVSITSDENSEPVYVRAKAFCGSKYTLVYSSENNKWTAGDDGYYYYSDIVYGGQTTEELLVKIENVPEGEDADSFDVVVIYETTPVLYHEDGTPYADWSLVLVDAAAPAAAAEGGE